MLSDLARRLGFGPIFDDVVGVAPAWAGGGRVSDGPWQAAMREALVEARAALATDDVPIGAVVLGPDGDVLGRGRNVREADLMLHILKQFI